MVGCLAVGVHGSAAVGAGPGSASASRPGWQAWSFARDGKVLRGSGAFCAGPFDARG
jgi:hypothetical protein